MKKILLKWIINKNRKFKFEDLEIRNILLETSWQLGDCIINSPLLEALVKQNPNLKMDVIVRENSMDMLKYYPYVKNIYPYRSHKNKILRYINRIFFAIKNRNKYDVVISFENGINTFHLFWLKILNGKFLMSLNKKEKYGIKEKDIKIVDWYFKDKFEILKKFEAINYNKKYKIYIGPYEESAKNFFANSKPNVIFNYIGSIDNKVLKAKEVKEILNLLGREDINIFVSSTPKKYLETQEIIKSIGRENIKVLPKTKNIFEIASYIKYSDILISVDTSLIHIASAYNKKVLGFYMNNDNIIKYATPNCDNYFIVKSKYKKKIENLNLKKIIEKFKKLL